MELGQQNAGKYSPMIQEVEKRTITIEQVISLTREQVAKMLTEDIERNGYRVVKINWEMQPQATDDGFGGVTAGYSVFTGAKVQVEIKEAELDEPN
jgi:hypothetical protein